MEEIIVKSYNKEEGVGIKPEASQKNNLQWVLSWF